MTNVHNHVVFNINSLNINSLTNRTTTREQIHDAVYPVSESLFNAAVYPLFSYILYGDR